MHWNKGFNIKTDFFRNIFPDFLGLTILWFISLFSPVLMIVVKRWIFWLFVLSALQSTWDKSPTKGFPPNVNNPKKCQCPPFQNLEIFALLDPSIWRKEKKSSWLAKCFNGIYRVARTIARRPLWQLMIVLIHLLTPYDHCQLPSSTTSVLKTDFPSPYAVCIAWKSGPLKIIALS